MEIKPNLNRKQCGYASYHYNSVDKCKNWVMSILCITISKINTLHLFQFFVHQGVANIIGYLEH